MEWINAPDPLQFVIDKPHPYEPGAVFEYSDGVAHLVSAMLTEVLDEPLVDFATRALFEPIGRPAPVWMTDDRGYAYGGVGLEITPRDMLAFGELVLNGGEHGGRRLVSAEWLQRSTQDWISPGRTSFASGYGFFWWLGDGAPYPYFYANGHGGQLIIVAPERDLVVVATCDWTLAREPAGTHWYQIMSTLVNVLMPAVE